MKIIVQLLSTVKKINTYILYLNLKTLKKKSLWIDSYYVNKNIVYNKKTPNPYKVIAFIKNVYSSKNKKELLCTLMINIKEEHLHDFLKKINISCNGKLFIINKQLNIIKESNNIKYNLFNNSTQDNLN